MAPRIVDAVFEPGAPPPRSQRLYAAFVVAVAIHLILGIVAFESAPPLGPWVAEMANRVHAELEHERLIETLPEPPKPPPEPPKPPPEPPKPQAKAAPPEPPRIAPPRHARPPAPAETAKVLARQPQPNEPVDLTGNTVITGEGTHFAGGASSSSGTNTRAVETPEVSPRGPSTPAPPPRKGPDRSRPVGFLSDDWSCPWPREADAEQIDEQVVTIRVVVRSDGSVESASLVTDPGYGFGAAALACARRTRFSPALDADGKAIRATSPPIRVHFTR